MPIEIVDIHPHVIAKDDDEAYPKRPLGGTQSTWSQERQLSHDELIAAMDSAGVAKAAVVQASTAYGHDNSYVADSVDAHRDRLAGVCSLDVLAPDAVQQLEYWIGERKMSGLRLFTTGSTMLAQGTWLDDPASYPAWQWVSDHGIPVCVQLRMSGLPLLRNMLSRFPAATVILDHLANPPISEGAPYTGCDELFRFADIPNVHLKLTTESLRNARSGAASPETFLPRLVADFGASRIAWGSNYPASGGSLNELVDLALNDIGTVLSADDTAWVLGKTALQLYPELATAAVTAS
jgi:L-fuconolactonase